MCLFCCVVVLTAGWPPLTGEPAILSPAPGRPSLPAMPGVCHPGHVTFLKYLLLCCPYLRCDLHSAKTYWPVRVTIYPPHSVMLLWDVQNGGGQVMD